MNAQELNNKIADGKVKYGSRNAYLASEEYRNLYAKYVRSNKNEPKKEAKKVKIESVEWANGFLIKISENGYLAHNGIQGGMLSGPMVFKTESDAIAYCQSKNLIF